MLYGLSIKDTIKIIKSKIYVTDHGLHFYKPLLNNDNKLFFDVNHGLPFQKWNSKIVDQWYKYKEVWLFSSFHKSIYHLNFLYARLISFVITIHYDFQDKSSNPQVYPIPTSFELWMFFFFNRNN